MHPMNRASSIGASAASSSAQHAQQQPLPLRERQALMRDIQDTFTKAQQLMHLVQSDDPSVNLPREQASNRLQHCRALADRSFLADVAPDLVSGRLRIPANMPPPAFTAQHASTVQQRATQVNALIREIRENAEARLSQSCRDLQDTMQGTRALATRLGVADRFPAFERAEQLLRQMSQRKGSDLDRCLIGKEESVLIKNSSELYRLRNALTSLIAARTGFEGSPPFSIDDHPAFKEQWNRVLEAVQKGQWAAYRSMEESLYEERVRLMKASDPSWVYPPLSLNTR